MGQFFRIMLHSPRLTIAAFLMIFGGISGAIKHREAEAKKPNPWSQGSSSTGYSAQAQVDDGWGNGTRPVDGKTPAGQGVTTQKVWKNEDGVVFEEEDVKALDRSEYE